MLDNNIIKILFHHTIFKTTIDFYYNIQKIPEYYKLSRNNDMLLSVIYPEDFITRDTEQYKINKIPNFFIVDGGVLRAITLTTEEKQQFQDITKKWFQLKHPLGQEKFSYYLSTENVLVYFRR